MNVLIVEDDEAKRDQLKDFFETQIEDPLVNCKRSLQGGLKEIISGDYDLIVLDMSLPTYDIGGGEDGGRPQSYAGREILRQMDRREINKPVVVVTQFDKFGKGADSLSRNALDDQLQKEHKQNYLGMVYYNPAVEIWKKDLIKLLRIIYR